LGPSGAVPGAAIVTVRLENTTGQFQRLPLGRAAADVLATPLDTLLDRAGKSRRSPRVPVVLPVAGRELPLRLTAEDVSASPQYVVAPLRVVGTITAPGTTAGLSGPATTLTDGGGRLAGVLSSTADFQLDVPQAARVQLDLTVTPSLDERSLRPPRGARSWAAWAQRSDLTDQALREATGVLVSGAASAARAATLSPYVGADTPGPATTSFRYQIADASEVAPAPRALKRKPYAVGVAGIAALAIMANGAALWRRL
jgi:hypothetical protein